VGAGSCTINASHPGTAAVAAASGSATLTVTKQPHSITVSVGRSSLVVDDFTEWNVTSSAGLTPTVSTSGGACVFDPTGPTTGAIVAVAAGTCTVSASHPGSAAVDAASGSVTLTVSRQADSVTIRLGDFQAGTFTQFAAFSGSGLPVSVSVSGACSLGEGALFGNAPGQCTVTGSTAGNGTFDPASNSVTVNVVPATPTFDISMARSTILGLDVPYSVFTNAPNVSVSVSGPCALIGGGASGSLRPTSTGRCTLTATVGGGIYANRTGSQDLFVDVLR
jgi:hypothetical protein